MHGSFEGFAVHRAAYPGGPEAEGLGIEHEGLKGVPERLLGMLRAGHRRRGVDLLADYDGAVQPVLIRIEKTEGYRYPVGVLDLFREHYELFQLRSTDALSVEGPYTAPGADQFGYMLHKAPPRVIKPLCGGCPILYNLFSF